MIQNEICCGENIKLGSNGKMNCISGKRMKKENRVFFLSEQQGYRLLWALHEYGIQKWRWIQAK